MTENMSMNRVIHGAFRRDLARFDRALAAFPDGSRARAEQLGTAWDNFAFQLHHHHNDEETIFWPLLRESGADEALVGELHGEHATMLAALEKASAKMAALPANPSAGTADAAHAAITDLSAVLLGHLEHEEGTIELVSDSIKGTQPMKDAEKAVQKAHKGNTGMFIAWLNDGIAPDAKACLDKEIPGPVQFVARNTSGRRYTKTVASVWA